MEIFYSSRFWREYKRLPFEVKEKAKEEEKIFLRDPFDRRLKTHKLQGRLDELWAFSINDRYRIVFEFLAKDRIMFHIIGDHSIYEKF